jgi:hypothetical protein
MKSLSFLAFVLFCGQIQRANNEREALRVEKREWCDIFVLEADLNQPCKQKGQHKTQCWPIPN